MPVPPCPACPPASPGSLPPQHAPSPRSWLRIALVSVVGITALAFATFAGIFMLAHGLTGLPGASPRPPAVAAAPRAIPPQRGSAPLPPVALTEGCASGNRTVWGDSLTIASAEQICGNVDVYGGDATIDGHVQGNVTVVGGSAIINGAVTGNVTAVGGNITLGHFADVGGNVDALGGDVRKAPTAIVGGNIEHGFTFQGFSPLSFLGFTGGFLVRWWNLLYWGLAAALAAVFFPRQLRNVRTVVRREPVVSLGVGVAALVVAVVAALMLFITCIGIPVALALVIAMWLAWMLGTVAIGLWIGEGLLRLGGAPDRSPVLASVMGVLLLTLCESIPCAGGLLGLAAGFTGLGASALALLHTRRAAALRSRMF